jgi:pimeloyl-ACP methyl ester carboxylesterase
MGYCMGGLLCIAAALRRPEQVAALGLITTPWDFHAADTEHATRVAPSGQMAPRRHALRIRAGGRWGSRKRLGSRTAALPAAAGCYSPGWTAPSRT